MFAETEATTRSYSTGGSVSNFPSQFFQCRVPDKKAAGATFEAIGMARTGLEPKHTGYIALDKQENICSKDGFSIRFVINRRF